MPYAFHEAMRRRFHYLLLLDLGTNDAIPRVQGNGSVAPHGLPDLILASSQFLVRISHENKRTMAAACGSLA